MEPRCSLVAQYILKITPFKGTNCNFLFNYLQKIISYILINKRRGILRSPMFATVQTRHKQCRRLIRTSRLHFIICTAFWSAFFARKHIRRRLCIIDIFRCIAFDFSVNQHFPMLGFKFVMRHKCHQLWCDIFISNLFKQIRVFQIDIYRSQSIRI